MPIQLWRSTPVSIPVVKDTKVNQEYSNAVITSARQGLTEAVNYLGLERTDYVGIPDYASHCVIDFIGRRATPAPIRMFKQESPSAILIYDQWGWQKSEKARSDIGLMYPGVQLIWDRVDSLPKSYQILAESDESQADVQVFSLKKTLTAMGGGLVWLQGKRWFRRDLSTDRELVELLEQMSQSFGKGCDIDRKVQTFIFRECDYHLRLQEWLDSYSIDAIAAHEHRERRNRIDHFVNKFPAEDLPQWMRDQIENYDSPAPGIWPIHGVNVDDNLLSKIHNKFDVDVRNYHFNYNDSYIEQQWTEVLAVPLHSEIQMEILDELIDCVINSSG